MLKLHKWYFIFIIINIKRENIFSFQTKKQDDKSIETKKCLMQCNLTMSKEKRNDNIDFTHFFYFQTE